MTNWIMLNLQAVPAEVAEAQQSRASHPGACHDGIWTLYTWIAPEAVAIARVFEPVQDVPDIAVIGQHLATQPSVPLIAPSSTLSALYRSAEWRLWCGRYEDWRDLEADHQAVFGAGVDGRKPLETLIAEAKEGLFQLFA